MEKLWEIVEKEAITVRYDDFSSTPEGIHGLYVYDKRIGPLIILGDHLHHSRRLHKCVLAEEIGHHYTAPRTSILTAHASANLQALESQDERKAMQWATDYLCPDREFDKALREGNRSCYDLAEYFDVTEWFMRRKVRFLKMCFRKQGLKVKGRDLFEISLQPCNVIS